MSTQEAVKSALYRLSFGENVVLLKIDQSNKAVRWLLRLSLLVSCASQLGSPTVRAEELLEAQDAFDRGEFVTALNLFDALAEGGDAQAQYQLGMMYEQGLGTDQDIRIAARWYTQAAEQRSPRV